jgi:high-affinity iron transporter
MSLTRVGAIATLLLAGAIGAFAAWPVSSPAPSRERALWYVESARIGYLEEMEEHEDEPADEPIEAVDAALAELRRLGGHPEWLAELERIRERIGAHADPVTVAVALEKLSAAIAAGIDRAPARAPDVDRGRRLYDRSCASCHGGPADPDPPAALTTRPRPARLHVSEQREYQTPYRVVAALRFGEHGEGGPSFSKLGPDDLWDIAFYVPSMKYARCDGDVPGLTLAQMATTPDDQLGVQIGEPALACARLSPAQAAARGRRVSSLP